MGIFSSLRREQKEAISVLQIGTFLEYFDLMLYVHMAVFLNELFFPKADPHTAALLSAFAFCSTFVFRPFGALIFGYIGDHVGRKPTVILTTMMMAVSCLIMANLPTYAQIGITAAWFVTICRIIQGLSSLGEIIGAEIYITEITKPPVRYVAVGLIAASSALGAVAALGVASLVTTSGMNWRLAFWIGMVIALVGSYARTRLRETPDFVDMKKRMKHAITAAEENGLKRAAELLKSTSVVSKEKVNKATVMAYFLIECGWPACFYFVYIYCGTILKSTFGYTPGQIISHNFILSIVGLASCLSFSLASYSVNPLKLLKLKTLVFLPLMISCPFFLSSLSSPISLLLFQVVLIFFPLSNVSASPIMFIHFPVFKRFTCASFVYALSRALIYIITSFAMVSLTDGLGHMGLLVIMVPLSMGFAWGVRHFEKLEKFRESPEGALIQRNQSRPIVHPDAA